MIGFTREMFGPVFGSVVNAVSIIGICCLFAAVIYLCVKSYLSE